MKRFFAAIAFAFAFCLGLNLASAQGSPTPAPTPTITQPQAINPSRVLFVGNSYFYYNDSLHNTLRKMLAAHDAAYENRCNTNLRPSVAPAFIITTSIGSRRPAALEWSKRFSWW